MLTILWLHLVAIETVIVNKVKKSLKVYAKLVIYRQVAPFFHFVQKFWQYLYNLLCKCAQELYFFFRLKVHLQNSCHRDKLCAYFHYLMGYQASLQK